MQIAIDTRRAWWAFGDEHAKRPFSKPSRLSLLAGVVVSASRRVILLVRRLMHCSRRWWQVRRSRPAFRLGLCILPDSIQIRIHAGISMCCPSAMLSITSTLLHIPGPRCGRSFVGKIKDVHREPPSVAAKIKNNQNIRHLLRLQNGYSIFMPFLVEYWQLRRHRPCGGTVELI